MTALAAAQAQALASLVAADASDHTSRPRAGGRHGGISVADAAMAALHVTGMDAATHASVFRSHGVTPVHAPSDYSALLLDDWLEGYMRERASFTSVSLFCEIKLRELIELTNTLHVSASDQQPSEHTRAAPSKLRTAVCVDLLDILIASVIQPEVAVANDPNGHTPHAQSRHALGHLLLKLRDELIKSIYVQPVPAHLFLQYTPYFHTKQPQQPNKPAPLQQRRSLPGSLTQRSRPAEEKTSDLGSSTHRGRIITTGRLSQPSPLFSQPSGPPSCISELLKCTEWFSVIPQHVARNRHLAEQARIIMIPSKLFRLRQIQKKVVGNMTAKWRELLLRWKFWEWRQVCAQKKQDRKNGRASKIVTRLTDRMVTLECRVQFYQWRQLVVHRKYRIMRDAKAKGLATNASLVEETLRLSEDTHLIREEIARLDASNINLAAELKALRAKLEHSQVDLQDTSKHQQQCGELLDALRAPLKHVFQAITQQLDSFSSREFSSIHPLLSTIVDPEFQPQLEPLGIPAMAGLENWSLSITQGTSKQRIAVCAELVARWLALQLKLCGTVLSGGAGNYSEYLVKLENQQRIAAALARIRQLCSASPPSTLPSFPIIRKPTKSDKAAAMAVIPGGLPMVRSRARGVPMLPMAPAELSKEQEDPAAPLSDEARARATARTSRMNLKKASMGGKVEELPPPPPGTEASNKTRRLAEGQAIPTGTLSTPVRVFAQLRDADRPETVFAISSVMMHADSEVARSMKLPAERRWTADERGKVASLRSLMDTLRVTADMSVADMDAAVHTAREGIDATHSALYRARSAQLRLQAIEDEVFAQSVKLLHQQSQRKHRHGERENNMPTDLLDVDISLFPDVIDPAALVKGELADTNKVFEEYCRDLHKIFSLYCQESRNAITAANMLANATQTELRMSNTEFWRFVRDCKLKLQQTALIDLVFLRVADRSSLDLEPTPAVASGLPSHTLGPASAASLLASIPDGMSLIKSEALAERARQSEAIHKDIGFKQFAETLLRLGIIKFPTEKTIGRKLKNMLLVHVLPNTSQKALAFHRQQLAAAQTSAAASIGAGSSSSSAPTNANLNTSEVDAVFRKYNTLLRQIFQIYARITPNFMTMTFNDFLGFAREFELLHKYVTQHDLKQLFSNVIRDMSGDDITNLTGGGIVAVPAAATSLKVAAEKVATVKRVTAMLGGAVGSDDGLPTGDDDLSPAKELSYRQFLELLAAVSHYVIRNPYFSLDVRVEKFISSVLASRKKLPAKVYRSAV